MDTKRLTQARRLFCHPNVNAQTARHNIRQWVRAVRMVRTTRRGWVLDQREATKA